VHKIREYLALFGKEKEIIELIILEYVLQSGCIIIVRLFFFTGLF
jgi:hypothetical protein